MRTTKTKRQHRIEELLEGNRISSQEHLVQLLSADGIEATQATVSRDLEELGAVKVRVPRAGLVYAIPETVFDRVVPEQHLRRVLGDWVVDVSYSQNLVVLQTPPGSAHVVASAVDRAGFEGVLGTVAGDDTVVVIATEEMGGNGLATALAELAAGEVE